MSLLNPTNIANVEDLSIEELRSGLDARIMFDARNDRAGMQTYKSPLARYNRNQIKAYRAEIRMRELHETIVSTLTR